MRGVRMGQPNPGQSRVVIDLARLVPFSAQTEGSNLTISFTASGVVGNPGCASTGHESPCSRKLVTITCSGNAASGLADGRTWGLRAPPMEPPAPPSHKIARRLRQQPAACFAGKKYTGDPISVNLKDVDLKDFFRLIHEISGLNVVLDPSVRGTVTLVLDEVPWDQALDIVLRNNGLTKEIDGNVLRIATQDTLKREADQRRDLVKAQSDAIETVTVTRVLSYAQANPHGDHAKKVPDASRRCLSRMFVRTP